MAEARYEAARLQGIEGLPDRKKTAALMVIKKDTMSVMNRKVADHKARSILKSANGRGQYVAGFIKQDIRFVKKRSEWKGELCIGHALR
jgi:hypothetical protein